MKNVNEGRPVIVGEMISFDDIPDSISSDLYDIGYTEENADNAIFTVNNRIIRVYDQFGHLDASDMKVLSNNKHFKSVQANEGFLTLRFRA